MTITTVITCDRCQSEINPRKGTPVVVKLESFNAGPPPSYTGHFCDACVIAFGRFLRGGGVE